MISISEIFCNDNHFYICIEYKSYKDKAVILLEGKENQLIFWEALCKLSNLLQQSVGESPFMEVLYDIVNSVLLYVIFLCKQEIGGEWNY